MINKAASGESGGGHGSGNEENARGLARIPSAYLPDLSKGEGGRVGQNTVMLGLRKGGLHKLPQVRLPGT